MKRTFDIVLAIISILVFAIPIAMIYLAIRIGGGKAIFRQERIGYGSKPFTIYKFRTMSDDAESDDRPRLYQDNDDRTTRIGRFLRSHHLDEFPQLWNILRGDMSFVGPRPERRYFVEQILQLRPDYVRLYALRPGIFSMATLYNGYTYNMDKMIRRLDMDLEYLEQSTKLRSQVIWFDIKIIWLTASAIITGKKF